MRCDDVREKLDALWDGEMAPEPGMHLAGCPDCSAYYHDLLQLRDGLNLWKQDEAPASSVGFAQRLIRQLGIDSKSPRVADFLELVGLRFVLGTLALVLLALFVFAVPSTGPVQSLSVADVQEQVTLSSSDPLSEANLLDASDSAPVRTPTPAVMNEGK
jgi:hypothetical protein